MIMEKFGELTNSDYDNLDALVEFLDITFNAPLYVTGKVLTTPKYAFIELSMITKIFDISHMQEAFEDKVTTRPIQENFEQRGLFDRRPAGERMKVRDNRYSLGDYSFKLYNTGLGGTKMDLHYARITLDRFKEPTLVHLEVDDRFKHAIGYEQEIMHHNH